jgi:hypothetical protein
VVFFAGFIFLSAIIFPLILFIPFFMIISPWIFSCLSSFWFLISFRLVAIQTPLLVAIQTLLTAS